MSTSPKLKVETTTTGLQWKSGRKRERSTVEYKDVNGRPVGVCLLILVRVEVGSNGREGGAILPRPREVYTPDSGKVKTENEKKGFTSLAHQGPGSHNKYYGKRKERKRETDEGDQPEDTGV